MSAVAPAGNVMPPESPLHRTSPRSQGSAGVDAANGLSHFERAARDAAAADAPPRLPVDPLAAPAPGGPRPPLPTDDDISRAARVLGSAAPMLGWRLGSFVCGSVVGVMAGIAFCAASGMAAIGYALSTTAVVAGVGVGLLAVGFLLALTCMTWAVKRDDLPAVRQARTDLENYRTQLLGQPRAMGIPGQLRTIAFALSGGQRVRAQAFLDTLIGVSVGAIISPPWMTPAVAGVVLLGAGTVNMASGALTFD